MERARERDGPRNSSTPSIAASCTIDFLVAPADADDSDPRPRTTHSRNPEISFLSTRSARIDLSMEALVEVAQRCLWCK